MLPCNCYSGCGNPDDVDTLNIATLDITILSIVLPAIDTLANTILSIVIMAIATLLLLP